MINRQNFLRLVFLVGLLAHFNASVLAQATPPWQAANQVRQSLLEAQKEMLAAVRAENPATHYESAAILIDQATAQYIEALQSEVAAAVPEADRSIQQALHVAREAALAGDAITLAAARGRVWTHILWGSYEATLAALTQGRADSASTWLQLREYRQATRVTVIEDVSTRAIAGLQAGEIEAAEASTIIGNDLRDAYFFRLREALNQLEEAGQNQFASRAAEWAGQARGYANILRADMATKLGDETATKLAAVLADLEQTALKEDWAAATAKIQAARAILAAYLPVELDAAQVAKRGQLLYLFTDLVYIEYKDGVRNGQITIPIEYQEAVTFRSQAEAVFEELRPLIAANDAQAAERYAQLLAEMETLMADLGEPTEVKVRVEEALALVERTLAVKADANDAEATLIVINTLFDDILAAVKEGRYEDAERSRLEAYAMFEGGMEQRLANRAIVLSRELEGLFWEGSGGQKGLATLLREQAKAEDVQTNVDLLRTKLDEGQTLLAAGLTGILAALNSLAIIIREGLEAVLIVGAILGYLRATGAPRKYSLWVYLGVAAAILLSVLTWIAAGTIITISVANRELLEGATSLIAVAVLFYVTNWLFHKVYVLDWLTFVKEQVSRAMGGGSALALAGLGFTVVYREGFETVLFYQALLFDAEAGWVLLGFVAGLAVILAISYAILRLSKRLPLKPFFTGTGILLLLLAFSLTGKGVRELQEAGVVAATLLPWLPENLLLMELFGLFPTVETTLAQLILVLAIVLTFALSHWQGQRKAVNPAVSSSR
ncbi:MAG: FTR1 family iron permease [Anaerolineae bacterium]|nr:FTR1 family iron permease [Anaerolineae bacterium]